MRQKTPNRSIPFQDGEEVQLKEDENDVELSKSTSFDNHKQVLEPYSSFFPAVFGKSKSCCHKNK